MYETGILLTAARDADAREDWSAAHRGPTRAGAFDELTHEFVPEGEPPREWYGRLQNIEQWTVAPAGGHVTAAEVPDPFAHDIRTRFGGADPRRRWER